MKDAATTVHADRHRFEPRLPIPVFVHSAGRWRAGEMRNVSRRGAFITLEADVWVGEEIQIVLGFPETAGGRLNVRAVTVWRTICERPDGRAVTAGYGVLFNPDPETNSMLVEAILRLSREGILTETVDGRRANARLRP